MKFNLDNVLPKPPAVLTGSPNMGHFLTTYVVWLGNCVSITYIQVNCRFALKYFLICHLHLHTQRICLYEKSAETYYDGFDIFSEHNFSCWQELLDFIPGQFWRLPSFRVVVESGLVWMVWMVWMVQSGGRSSPTFGRFTPRTCHLKKALNTRENVLDNATADIVDKHHGAGVR